VNVLWLTHAIPYPPKAGFLSRTYHLLRELARHQTVDLISFVQEPWVRTLFPNLEQGLDESRQALASICRKVTFLPIDSVAHHGGKHLTALRALLTGSAYTTTWLVSTPARRAIAAEIASNSYDLVHFDTIGLAPYRPLVAHVPAILTHHNIESHMMKRRAENATNLFARRYFLHEAQKLQQIEQHVASRFVAHITCSELDSVRLSQIVPSAKVIEIPNGVDCEFFSSTAPATRPKSIVFVGTMNWYPNVDAMMFFLREIWPPLKRRVPEATLDIAGSNPPGSLLRVAQSLPGVTVHGYVPDVRPLIDSAAIFVCPIRDGGGTKLKILDAFAMQKCVVAHPIACEGINVTAGRNVILASDAAEFVSEITRLLAHDGERLAIGVAARDLVKREYSFHRIGELLNSTIEAIVQRRRAEFRTDRARA
jgi:glycosyltransferase involved in cell wall biosynthesis